MKRPLSALLLAAPLFGAGISTANWDLNRTGTNPNEVQITAANVTQLQPSYSLPVSGAVYAQPLVVSLGATNGLITCTMTNDCYAFDTSTGLQLWHTSLGITPRAVFNSGQNIGQFYGSGVGCLATPAIDLQLHKVFAICATSVPSWILFSLDLTSGTVLGSVTITGSVSGTGDPSGGDLSFGGSLTFNPAYELARGAVAIANGNVYVSFSGYNDTHPYHGWIMAYSEDVLEPSGVFCSTPSGGAGGIWMAGGGIAVDASGNLYVPTGNGTFDGTVNFANSILKLSATLTLVDWFTPSNYAALSSADADLASNRVILIPGTHYLVHTGKAFQVFVLDTTSMGHLQGTGTAPIQAWTMAGTPGNDSGAYGSLWSGGVFYIPTTTGVISAFQWLGGSFNTTPIASTTLAVGSPGTASIAGTPGIVWTVTTSTTSAADEAPQQGVLHALNANSLSELWNSGAFGTMTKFTAATVVNGQVYIATQDGKILSWALPVSVNGPDVDTPASVPTANKTSPAGTIFLLAAADVATAAQGTPLCVSAGLATTIGCPTGGTGGSGSVTTIQTITLSAAAPSVTFSAIPQTYMELELTITGRGDAAAATVYGKLQFNGDTGNNYNFYNFISNWNAGQSAQSDINICSFTANSGTVTAGYPGTCAVRIPLYSQATFRKVVLEDDGTHTSGSGTSTGVSFGDWASAAPITSFTFTASLGNFTPGTTFILRGLN